MITPSSRQNFRDPESSLYAANDTPIATFGEKLINLDLGLRRPYKWVFTIADVSKPIIGADLLQHYDLLVDVKRKRLCDRSTSLEVIGHLSSQPSTQLSTVRRQAETFKDLLSEFHDLTISSLTPVPVKHTVVHHIVTKGPPIYSKARRLSTEKLKIAKAEFAFMCEQGIFRPSSSCYASPLHLVPKKNGDWRPCGDYRRLNAALLRQTNIHFRTSKILRNLWPVHLFSQNWISSGPIIRFPFTPTTSTKRLSLRRLDCLSSL